MPVQVSSIPVHYTVRLPKKQTAVYTHRRFTSDLVTIKTVPANHLRNSFLNGCLWNLRFISNEPFIVNDFISSNGFAFIFLVETWSDTVVPLVESCPHGYTLWNSPRLSGQGGWDFLTELGDLLSISTTNYERVFLLGDFNIHVDNNNDRLASEFLDLIQTFD